MLRVAYQYRISPTIYKLCGVQKPFLIEEITLVKLKYNITISLWIHKFWLMVTNFLGIKNKFQQTYLTDPH